jgi:hypothetical protein
MSTRKIENLIENSKNSTQLTGNFIDNQKKQVENILSNISDTANKVNVTTVCTNSIDSSTFTLKNIKTMNRYHNKLITTVKETSYSFIELQKNVINTNQSVYSQFLTNNLSKFYWENFNITETYSQVYNTINKNIINDIINNTNIANELVLTYADKSRGIYAETIYNIIKKCIEFYYNKEKEKEY